MTEANDLTGNQICCVVVKKSMVKKIKTILESRQLLHKEYRISEYQHGLMAIPVNFRYVHNPEINNSEQYTELCDFSDDIHTTSIVFINKIKLKEGKVTSPHTKIMTYCSEKLTMAEISDLRKWEMLLEIPTKWEIHGDLIMFSEDSFCSSEWQSYCDEQFWKGIAEILRVQRIALMSRIKNDRFRTPIVKIVYGVENGWVKHVDNGITYTYDVTKNMFSKGNITEKLRIARMDCSDETIVDMFAGIGYFTLPFLLKARAKFLYACEWNADAVDALRKNMFLNGVPEERYVVLHGDNREVAPKNVADRVNLGLIPTSRGSWLVACEALNVKTGGCLHIHENIDSGPNADGTCECPRETKCIVRKTYKDTLKCRKRVVWCSTIRRILNTLQSYFATLHSKEWNVYISHVEHVKEYAPHVDHVVLDVQCCPTITLSDK